MTLSYKSLGEQLKASCCKFIEHAMPLGRKYFGRDTLPMRDVEVHVMEPTGPEHWSGRLFKHRLMDASSIQGFFESEELESTTAWADAKNAIEAYVEDSGILPIGFPIKDVESQYLTPLFTTYLTRVGRFVHRKRTADVVITYKYD